MAAPIYSVKKQGFNVAIWGDANSPRISFQKTYKDKMSGAYKETKYFFDNELPTLISMLQEAQAWIATNRTNGQDVRTVMGANFDIKSDDDIEDLPF